MKFPTPVRDAVLVRRYKRFLADVTVGDGEALTVHCANPGSMLGVSRPGSPVLISRSSRPGRSLPWSLEAVRVGRAWVGVHPQRANHVVEEALRRGKIEPLRGYRDLRREAPWEGGGRADFLLESPRKRCWVEVKQVTAARDGVALFPDAVTERGHRHLKELTRRAGEEDRAVLILAVPRKDVDAVGFADGIDPEFGRLARKAARHGVEILGYHIRVTRAGLTLGRPLPLAPERHPYRKEDWIE